MACRASEHQTFWYDVDRAAWTAVQNRGRIVRCGPVAFKCVGASLQLKLPSGRKLAYPQPAPTATSAGSTSCLPTIPPADGATVATAAAPTAALWTENIVAGISRDLLADAMLRIEAAGYPIVLHVHDEIVCEVPEGFGSTEEFTRIHDPRAVLGADAADRSESAWSRAASSAGGGTHVDDRLTTELPLQPQLKGGIQWCC